MVEGAIVTVCLDAKTKQRLLRILNGTSSVINAHRDRLTPAHFLYLLLTDLYHTGRIDLEAEEDRLRVYEGFHPDMFRKATQYLLTFVGGEPM